MEAEKRLLEVAGGYLCLFCCPDPIWQSQIVDFPQWDITNPIWRSSRRLKGLIFCVERYDSKILPPQGKSWGCGSTFGGQLRSILLCKSLVEGVSDIKLSFMHLFSWTCFWGQGGGWKRTTVGCCLRIFQFFKHKKLWTETRHAKPSWKVRKIFVKGLVKVKRSKKD